MAKQKVKGINLKRENVNRLLAWWNVIVEWSRKRWAEKRNRPWIVGAGGVCVVVVLFATWIFWWPNSFSNPDSRVINVSRGDSFARVVDSLYAQGIIGSKTSIKIAGRILGGATELKVGRYTFAGGVSNLSIIRDLREGNRTLIPVSIPEGIRMTTVARRLSKELGVDSAKVMELCLDSAVAVAWGIPDLSVEGYLLPDTYFFHWQTDERDLVERFLQAFREFYVDSLQARASQLGMTTHQILTFASIVDRETQIPDERPVVAGVYHNRLKRRMRLEADPTIQYILPDGPRRLLYSDLRVPSRYNTYRNYGLPPGPIGNPGREAILATLYPTEHQYYYFVADGRGGHTFTKTYEEHQRAVRVYRRVRREMQRETTLGR
ncbi:MAG: endolytic transglycosylase MltG [Bacteroidota bacterium]